MKIDMMKHFLGDTVPPTFRGTIIRQSNKVFGPHRSAALEKRLQLTTVSTREAFSTKYKLVQRGIVVCFLSRHWGRRLRDKSLRSQRSAALMPLHKRSGRMEDFCGELIKRNYCTVGKWLFGFVVGSKVSRFRWWTCFCSLLLDAQRLEIIFSLPNSVSVSGQ
jgi:hypothetical protein